MDGKKQYNKTSETDKELAFVYYMQMLSQKDIAQKIGCSQKTISRWKQEYNWEAKRAAKTISMDGLIQKALQKINELLEEKDFNADSFAKAVAQLKSLKPENTIDNIVLSFLNFQNWIIANRAQKRIDDSFIKKLVALQDEYVQRKLNNEA